MKYLAGLHTPKPEKRQTVESDQHDRVESEENGSKLLRRKKT